MNYIHAKLQNVVSFVPPDMLKVTWFPDFFELGFRCYYWDGWDAWRPCRTDNMGRRGLRVEERSACLGRAHYKEGTFHARHTIQSITVQPQKEDDTNDHQHHVTHGMAGIMIDFCSLLYHFDFWQWWDREDVHCHAHVNSGTCERHIGDDDEIDHYQINETTKEGGALKGAVLRFKIN